MANYGNYPAKYLTFNAQTSKQLAFIMKIEGITTPFGVSDTFETVRYGAFGIIYGLPGLVYGGLKKVGGPNGVGGVKPYIQLDSGMVIQQRIEPEQGKGNIGTVNITLIDKNGEISYMIAPGNVVDEIMTSKQVTLYIGFQQTSYPEDYVILYRGYITSLVCPPGLVRFQLSDGTMKARQPVFDTPSTNTTAPLDAVTTIVPVLNTNGFYSQILGPDGSYDSTAHTFIKIDDEYMSYGTGGILNPLTFSVSRGDIGSLPAPHDDDAQVTNVIMLGLDADGQGVNFVTLALKLLLSGWNGNCETDISISSIGFVPPDVVSNAFVLGSDDANLDLGLTVGDYFTISGSIVTGNNVTGIITGFGVLNSFTTIVYTDQTFTVEMSTLGVAAFRSKYDTLPTVAGAKCRMRDVDVETFEGLRSAYFLSSLYHVAVFYDSPVFAKDIVATDLFLPFGCYQISRYGRISMSVTKPPLPGVTGKLVELNVNNVLNPQSITVNRSTNNRSFYNQVSYEYDFNPNGGVFGAIQYFVDTQSLSQFDQTLTLPIQAKALRSRFGAATVASIRGQALLSRYKKVALTIELTVNWSVGSLIEVSDIVSLVDNGNLKIMNFETGLRNIGTQLFEVIDRSYNVFAGNVKLKLLGGLGFNIDNRFGLFSPSSIVTDGSTGTLLRLTPSYGQTKIADELVKWQPYFGLPITVHSSDYTVIGTSNLVGFNAADTTALDISPDLGFIPASGYIVEIANYPTSTDKNENAQYKALYACLTPTILITSGTSDTEFDIASGDMPNVTIGNQVIVRNQDWTVISQDVFVSATGVTTVTVADPLKNKLAPFNTFTPDNTFVMEGIGFKDSNGYYRYD